MFAPQHNRVPAGSAAVNHAVQFTATYYYEGDSPDVDNIIKPIYKNALNGVVFVDDAQVAETKARKRPLDGSYQIKGASGILLQGFAGGVSFLHVRVEAEYTQRGAGLMKPENTNRESQRVTELAAEYEQ